jgi:hypothetical protein
LDFVEFGIDGFWECWVLDGFWDFEKFWVEPGMISGRT